jgi:hypothetical protein
MARWPAGKIATKRTKLLLFLALRILAEIDLNRPDLYRDTFIELVWSFEQRNPPTRFYPIGG